MLEHLELHGLCRIGDRRRGVALDLGSNTYSMGGQPYTFNDRGKSYSWSGNARLCFIGAHANPAAEELPAFPAKAILNGGFVHGRLVGPKQNSEETYTDGGVATVLTMQDAFGSWIYVDANGKNWGVDCCKVKSTGKGALRFRRFGLFSIHRDHPGRLEYLHVFDDTRPGLYLLDAKTDGSKVCGYAGTQRYGYTLSGVPGEPGEPGFSVTSTEIYPVGEHGVWQFSVGEETETYPNYTKWRYTGDVLIEADAFVAATETIAVTSDPSSPVTIHLTSADTEKEYVYTYTFTHTWAIGSTATSVSFQVVRTETYTQTDAWEIPEPLQSYLEFAQATTEVLTCAAFPEINTSHEYPTGTVSIGDTVPLNELVIESAWAMTGYLNGLDGHLAGLSHGWWGYGYCMIGGVATGYIDGVASVQQRGIFRGPSASVRAAGSKGAPSDHDNFTVNPCTGEVFVGSGNTPAFAL